jgi:hypothetical protein
VIAITDKSGISSAQNLQITALAVSGIGITDTHMAQPTKKMIVFIDTDRTFFIQYTSLSNSNINVSTQKARRNLTKITAGLMVEAAGVEPASESTLTGLSPGAVKI